jgi:5-(carboxyamino)imidazole ribonucleotide synthase
MKIGVVGAGQLGRMMGEAGHPLGVECRFLDPSDTPCAATAGQVVKAAYDDAEALAELAAWADVITYEFENVPTEAVQGLSVPVYPPPRALEVAQDRLTEKRFFQDQQVPVAPFAPVATEAELAAAMVALGLPAILKTRRLGYDGKGQFVINDEAQGAGAFRALGEVPCILEKVVPFDRELSVLSARRPSGEVVTWPLVQNRHAGGILQWSEAPAPATDAQQDEAARIARRVLEALDYVGVLAIELFDLGGHLLANEMAPRVHNSGHWSIEGSVTSQFENHLRAVLDLPLGDTAMAAPSGMLNLIGTEPPLAELLSVPGARVHRYGKSPRPGRKLGHVTVVGATPDEVRERLHRLRAVVQGVEQG